MFLWKDPGHGTQGRRSIKLFALIFPTMRPGRDDGLVLQQARRVSKIAIVGNSGFPKCTRREKHILVISLKS